jgi:23S rRNA (adenine2503-C2)-methyltransferase
VNVALQALSPEDLARRAGIDLVDARRIVSLVHRHGALPERSPATIRRAALDLARAVGDVPSIELVERRASTVDPFVKFAFRLSDGAIVETVRIPLEKPGRFSVCVSSQVGCALACSFCATGTMGLKRNLETWEIVEQVRRVRQDMIADPPVLQADPAADEGEGGDAAQGDARATASRKPRAKVHGVLFQGMGEPMANLDRVIDAIRVLGEPSAQAIDVRNITVCTAGIPSGIRRLAEEVPAARLGVSLGTAKPGARRSLMPIDGAHPLASVMEAAGEHARATGHAPMFAYTLLAGHNDDDTDAAALAELVLDFAKVHGVRPRLSLIPFNRFEGNDFERSARMEAFREALSARGAFSIVRYSGGGDVGAACGQLVTASAGAPGGRRRLAAG